MKKLLVFMFTLLFAGSAIATISIDNVSVIPPGPSIFDIITIDVDGYSSTNFNGIDSTDFTIDNTNLTLDIYCEVGIMAIVENWDHQEVINTLPADTYNLTVNAYSIGQFPLPPTTYNLDDTYTTSFEVIPEPTTVLLLSLGGLLLRRKYRTK